MELLIASNNSGKIGEIKNFLKNLPINIFSLEEWKLLKSLNGPVPDPVEDGLTYQENALIKARICYQWAGIPCLADDTGLEVEALDGEPGLLSARYAGEQATFADNLSKILQELDGVKNRGARFKACLVYFDGQQTKTFFGEISGEILSSSQGIGGFGYDPVFRPIGSSQTFAELKLSDPDFPTHRVLALKGFREFLFASVLRKVQ